MNTSHRQARPASAIERAGLVPDAPRPAPGPAATPQARHNPLVALVHAGDDRAILGAITAGMGAALQAANLALVLQPLTADTAAAQVQEFLRRYRPAGLVLAPTLAEREDLEAICGASQIPCVRLGRIGCDERRAAADLVAWLIAQGHARIGFVAGPEGLRSARQRELGYLDAMADAGLDRGPALIVPGDDGFESGIAAGRLLLDISPRPTAIVASTDEMAVGVLHAAAQIGVAVPTQLSVAGFDDTPHAARALPSLTSMRVPWQRMAGMAVAQILGGPQATFAAELMVRGSVQTRV